MGLPDLVELVPLNSPVRAKVSVPGSKSITNRALVLAALADGTTILSGALWSEDTQVMVDCLQRLGFKLHVSPDPAEPCNRVISVNGQGGSIPNSGTPEKPLELHVGNAGTAARFLTALTCLSDGCIRLSGIPRMHERPQASLITALRELGYRIDSSSERLPAIVHGGGPRAATCTVSIAASSQFASALLLTGTRAKWTVNIAADSEDNAPYVEMTRRLIESFPLTGGEFQIEPDASSGSYIWGANWILNQARSSGATHGSKLEVPHWPTSGWQIDADFPDRLPLDETRLASLSREQHLGDSIMTAITLGALSSSPVSFTELGRLRVQECERVTALRTELTKCGAEVVEDGDTLKITPSELHGATIDTYNDHRMAMCFAVLGLHVPGLKIQNPTCVKKTFPNFFQKLATPSPDGLGVEIRNGSTGETLRDSELFAD